MAINERLTGEISNTESLTSGVYKLTAGEVLHFDTWARDQHPGGLNLRHECSEYLLNLDSVVTQITQKRGMDYFSEKIHTSYKGEFEYTKSGIDYRLQYRT